MFAPDSMGFTHTWGDTFSHFEGSDAGASSTFGMPATELAVLIRAFIRDIRSQYGASNNELTKEFVAKLVTMEQKMNRFVDMLENNPPLSTIANMLNEFGHIPLIMSAISATAKYQIAGQNVVRQHLEWYFGNIPGAQKQGVEFLVEQSLMKLVRDYRKECAAKRYSTAQSNDAFYFFNDVIIRIDRDIIKVNQKTLPMSETFDRCDAFKEKIWDMASQIPKTEQFEKVRTDIAAALKNASGHTYPAQKRLSQDLFACLKNYFAAFGIADDVEFEMSIAVYEQIKVVLPVVEYLASKKNAFACNGLYGEEIRSPFHSICLAAYEKHETDVYCKGDLGTKGAFYILGEHEFTAPSFNEDQLDALLFGDEDYAERQESNESFFSSLGSTLAGLVTEGDGNALRNRNLAREQATRRETPEIYLALTNEAHVHTPHESSNSK